MSNSLNLTNVDTYNEFGNRYSNWATEGGYRQAHAHGTRRPPYTSSSGSGSSGPLRRRSERLAAGARPL